LNKKQDLSCSQSSSSEVGWTRRNLWLTVAAAFVPLSYTFNSIVWRWVRAKRCAFVCSCST